jgi:hypothetical protein
VVNLLDGFLEELERLQQRDRDGIIQAWIGSWRLGDNLLSVKATLNSFY